MNKREEKFKFISIDEIENNVDIDNVEIVDVPKEVSINKKNDTINSDSHNEEIPIKKELVEDRVSDIDDDNKNLKGHHFNFGTRVLVMVLLILLLLGGTCVLIYEAIHYAKSDVVTFDEVSKNNYEVCPLGEDIACLEENKKYNSSNIKSVNITFDYSIEFSKVTSYDLNYYINAVTNIYDKEDSSKLLYTNEEILVDQTTISDTKNSMNIYKNVTLDYYKNNRYVVDYKNLYDKEYTGEVEVTLYLIENGENRKVSSITVPLNSSSFSIDKYNISNTNRDENIINEGWSKYSMMCAIIASILVFISLILIYRVTQLILRVINSRNRYQQRLEQILRDYDRIIVIARDGYESNVARNEVKLDSFDKLLDVKDHLSKPIIFSKVNEVKCEFIVEDDETLYKYVLKDDE